MTQERLASLENEQVGGDIKPYSNFLRFIRTAIILVVLGVVGFLFLWPRLSQVETQPLTQRDVAALRQAETENTLLNPVFNSRDSRNQPFTVTAAEAIQNRESTHVVALKTPTAKFYDDRNEPISVTATSGTYNQDTRALQLDQNITLSLSQGVITGDQLLINQQSQTITFYGPTKAVIKGH